MLNILMFANVGSGIKNYNYVADFLGYVLLASEIVRAQSPSRTSKNHSQGEDLLLDRKAKKVIRGNVGNWGGCNSCRSPSWPEAPLSPHQESGQEGRGLRSVVGFAL